MISIKTHIISEAFEQLSKSEKLNESKSKFIESNTQFDIHAVLNANGEYEDLTKVVKDPSKIIVYDTWNQMLKDRDNLHTYYIRQNGAKEYEVIKYSKWSGDQYFGYLGPQGYSSLKELYDRNPGKYDDDDVCLVKEFHVDEKLQEKLDKKEIDLKLLNKDPAIYVSPEDAFELSQYLDSKNILYGTRDVLTPIPEKNYEEKRQREFWIDYSSPRSIATPNEMVTLRHSDCSILGSIGTQTGAFDFPYISPASNKLPRISRSDYYKLKSLFKDLNKIWKKPEYQDKQNELVDKISDIVSDIQGINELLNKDNSKNDMSVNKIAEDYNEVNECKLGTNEYEANPKRKQHIEMYRKFANLNESEEITEDNINDWALQKTATYCNRHPDRIKAEILGKRYSEYERD